MMKINRMGAVAAAGLALALPMWHAGGSADAEVAAPQQSMRQAQKGVSPTWKVFSTPNGRGTSIAVSTGGNITAYASPNDDEGSYEHIGVGAVGEGYVLCYAGQSGPVNRYDVGQSQSGFTEPVANARQISRKTIDGKMQLVQQFSLTQALSAAYPTNFNITMSVTNLTSAPMTGVILRRQTDFDIDTGGSAGWAGFLSNHARTKGSVSAFHDPSEAPGGQEAHGIQMSSTGGAPVTPLITQDILDPTCAPSQATLSPDYFVARGDYGDSLSWNVGTLKAGATKTVTMRYLRY